MVHPLSSPPGASSPSTIEARAGESARQTLGVPLFQEQACGSPSNAPASRRRGRCFASHGHLQIHRRRLAFRDKLIAGIVTNGYEPSLPNRPSSNEGFSSYGFPEATQPLCADRLRLSLAEMLAPEIFCAALLNSQPMGYAGSDLRDARSRRRDPPGLRQRLDGTALSPPAAMSGSPFASVCAWSRGSPTPRASIVTVGRTSPSAQ